MTMRSDHFGYLMAPGLYHRFYLWLKEHAPFYTQIMNIESSKRQYEEVTKISGFGVMPQKAEGVAVTYDDMVQGGKKTYTHVAWGLAYRVTQECFEDELYNTINRATEALAKSARNRIEVQAASVYNNAFSTSYVGITSGESLCYATHALLKGGTYANRPSTEVDLSLTALQAALSNYDKLVDEDNMKVKVVPKVLVIPPDLRFVAKELLMSQFKPYTANNEVNPVGDEGLSFFVNPYLTDTDAWFLQAAKGDHNLKVFWRIRPEFDAGEDFDSGDMKNKCRMRFVCGFDDWRGIYGTQGA